MLSAVEEAVIATGLDGKIIYWNSAAESLYGWSAAEAVGGDVVEMIPAEGAHEQATEIMALLREGKSWSGEFVVRRRDGSVFPIMVTDSPIFDESGKLAGIVGVSIDISERKQAEAERERLHQSEREARAEAEKANRSKDEFLATLSHELRNPLNVILGYSELLLRSEEARSSQLVRRAAEVLKRNALGQSRLVRDLLDLSRLHLGKFSLNCEVVSLLTILNSALETVSDEAAAKEIQIRCESPEDVILVDVDPLRLEQVIWNLLNNALKFTSARGEIAIHLSRGQETATISIEDNGPGIEPEFLPYVFEMFRQADASSSRSHGGMGIGLALFQQLIDLHKGRVAVESVMGEGTKFTIELPVARGSEVAIDVVPQMQSGVLGQMRVLVVDDSADTVDMLKRLLEMEGALVATARGGDEALQIARDREFDVVLSDISMPRMDGFEFVRRLREIEKHAHVPVLALTGFGRQEDVAHAKAQGFVSHVTKPIDISDLIERIRQLSPKNEQAAAG